MRRGQRAWCAATALAVLCAACPLPSRAARADAAAAAAAVADTVASAPRAAVDVTAALERAREQLRDGDYDRAIEVLKAALEAARPDAAQLREVYLLLVKTYVFLGNDLKFKPQGREASNLNYQEARRLIAECLAVPALRHTLPVPASAYPPEMLAFFAEARAKTFGAFRVLSLEPRDAVVLFDGDTLRAAAGDSLPGDVDLAAGVHVVTVRAPKRRELVDRVTISPGVTMERSYALERRRGPGWYAARGAGALAIVGGAIAAFGSKGDGGGTTAAPLPGAPDPP